MASALLQQPQQRTAEATLLDDFLATWHHSDGEDEHEPRLGVLRAFDAGSPTPARTKRAGTLARRRVEIAALRAQELELRKLLARLSGVPEPELATESPEPELAIEATALALASATTTENRSLDAAPPASCNWKQLALRERVRLRRARLANQELRASALELSRRTAALRRILFVRAPSALAAMQSSLRFSVTPTAPPAAFWRLRPATIEHGDAARALLLTDLDAACECAGAVLSRLAPPERCGGAARRWLWRRDADGVVFLEVEHWLEVPFAREDVAAVLRPPGAAGAAVTSELQAQYASQRLAGAYRLHLAQRAFERADRRLSVAVAYVDAAPGGPPLPGGVLRDEQWTVATERASVDATSGLARRSTLLQTLSRIAPVRARGSRPRLWSDDVIERELIPAWDFVITFAHREIENKLLARTMETRHRGGIEAAVASA